ncbi:neurotrypsin-like [Lineus longissimus]|uniref:neurotrypsin-like n=1 Tax=Lineus longissimus TaxID=88925 RepID=UPI00315DE189
MRGYLRVKYDGNLGFVTDTDWTEEDATIACKQVDSALDAGFPILGEFRRWLGHNVSTIRSWYQYHPVFLSAPECNGTERSLHQCPNARRYPGPGNYSNLAAAFCYKKELASVKSDDFSIDPSTSKVYIKYLEVLGYVCASGWSQNAANVLCRQKKTFHWANPIDFGVVWDRRNRPIWIKELNCTGAETSLDQCNLGKLKIHVDCANVSTVSCHKVRPGHFSIESSAVLLTYRGQKGYVCATGWTQLAADVLCRKRGFHWAQPVGSGSPVTGNDKPVWIKAVNCSGTEESLAKCYLGTPGPHTDCLKYAEVVCGNDVTASQFWISSSTVVVKYFDENGYVCAANWTQQAADVLCRQNSSHWAQPIGPGSDVSDNVKPVWMSNITCIGNETTLDHCILGRPRNHTDCTKYAEVVCGKNGKKTSN